LHLGPIKGQQGQEAGPPGKRLAEGLLDVGLLTPCDNESSRSWVFIDHGLERGKKVRCALDLVEYGAILVK
jgi:hypothetical protein